MLPGSTADRKALEAGTEVNAMIIGPLLADLCNA
jgi:hypothetical protein